MAKFICGHRKGSQSQLWNGPERYLEVISKVGEEWIRFEAFERNEDGTIIKPGRTKVYDTDDYPEHVWKGLLEIGQIRLLDEVDIRLINAQR